MRRSSPGGRTAVDGHGRAASFLAGRRCLALFLVLYSVMNLAWVWQYRRGQPYDIDEAGYLSFSLVFHNALGSGGLPGWSESILSPSIFAPLTTAASSVPYVLFGPGATTGLIVPVLFGTQAALFTYLIGDRIGGRKCAWLSLVLVAGTPVLISYTRSYNFAIGAAAMFVSAVYFLLASEGMTRTRFAIGFGIFFGLTALSRTVMLAFLPSLVVAALLTIAAHRSWRLGVRNGLIAALFALAVALPWYARNGSAVLDYLTSFGYGDRSVEYGRQNSFLSWGAWRETLSYMVYSFYLPLTLLLVVALAASIAYASVTCRRTGLRAGIALIAKSQVLPVAVIAAQVLIVLTSSRNKGSGFLAPVAPLLMVLVAWAITRSSGWRGRILPLAAVSVAAVNFMAAISPASPLAPPRSVDVPWYGEASVVDGRGTIQTYEAADIPELQDTAMPMSDAEGEEWVAANTYVAELLRGQGGVNAVTSFGFRHRLLNTNSVQLQQLLSGGGQLPMDSVVPVVAGDTVDGYSEWLETGASQRACNLLTATGTSYEFAPVVSSELMERAAAQSGFVALSSWPLPDGRVVTLWKRVEFCPAA